DHCGCAEDCFAERARARACDRGEWDAAMDLRAWPRPEKPDPSAGARRPGVAGDAGRLDVSESVGGLLHGGRVGPARSGEDIFAERSEDRCTDADAAADGERYGGGDRVFAANVWQAEDLSAGAFVGVGAWD